MPLLSRVGSLRFGCLLDGAPLRGGWVGVWLGTTAKNPFHSLHGPANHQGVVTVTGEALLASSMAEASVALMDYVSPVDGLDGTIVVEGVNLDDIARALGAFDQFSDNFPYPSGYAEGLRLLSDRLEGSPSGVLDVSVLTGDESGGFRLTARPRRRVSEREAHT